jgi:hypothetical protein
MNEQVTVILGIVIPSVSPIFLTTVGVHILIALVCVVAGAIAMFAEKRPGKHPLAGRIYFWFLAGVFATATVLSVVRWEHNYHLFVLGVASFSAAWLGRTALIQRWRNWARIHIAGMGSSYVFLLIAFYVDNGRNLPLWKDLPPTAYWLLPAAVGVPLILRALLRHPLARASRAR